MCLSYGNYLVITKLDSSSDQAPGQAHSHQTSVMLANHLQPVTTTRVEGRQHNILKTPPRRTAVNNVTCSIILSGLPNAFCKTAVQNTGATPKWYQKTSTAVPTLWDGGKTNCLCKSMSAARFHGCVYASQPARAQAMRLWRDFCFQRTRSHTHKKGLKTCCCQQGCTRTRHTEAHVYVAVSAGVGG